MAFWTLSQTSCARSVLSRTNFRFSSLSFDVMEHFWHRWYRQRCCVWCPRQRVYNAYFWLLSKASSYLAQWPCLLKFRPTSDSLRVMNWRRLSYSALDSFAQFILWCGRCYCLNLEALKLHRSAWNLSWCFTSVLRDAKVVIFRRGEPWSALCTCWRAGDLYLVSLFVSELFHGFSKPSCLVGSRFLLTAFTSTTILCSWCCASSSN